jgi:hypothetical protein
MLNLLLLFVSSAKIFPDIKSIDKALKNESSEIVPQSSEVSSINEKGTEPLEILIEENTLINIEELGEKVQLSQLEVEEKPGERTLEIEEESEILLGSKDAHADSDNPLWARRIRINILEVLTPIPPVWLSRVPILSKINIGIPFSLFSNTGVVSKLDIEMWYLASSPFFFPDPFLEAGFLLDYVLIESRVLRFEAGCGTAYSQDLSGKYLISVPFIIDVRGQYFPSRWFALETLLNTRLYGEGLILEGFLMASFKPFKSSLFRGLILGIGPGVSYYYSSSSDVKFRFLHISASVGYFFKEPNR